MTEVWTRWEGQVVNGVYPLRRFLNASDHSAVFLTETTTAGCLNAAIKIVPADPASSELQLWHWKTAITFSHPHLMRLLDSGQCEIQGRQFLFVVMEYAEENLAQILPYRALTAGEVRELLVPTLDTLSFLHRENWVQGQLKPSNVLVVDDQLKLAADTIRPIGVSRESASRTSIYDSPETDEGQISSAGDVWALGVTLVEALTQYPPSWPNGKSAPPTFSKEVPAEFLDTIQRCLSRDPADRPTLAALQIQTKPGARAPASSTPVSTASPPAHAKASAPASTPPVSKASAPSPAPAAMPAAARQAARPQTPATPKAGEVMRAAPHTRPFEEAEPTSAVPKIAAIVILFAALWGGWRLYHQSAQAPTSPAPARGQPTQPTAARPDEAQPPPSKPATPPPPRAETGTTSPAPTATQGNSALTPPATASGRTPAGSAPGVLHEEIPKVSPSARDTIRGHIRVYVRVAVDRSGNVVHDSLERPGPSNYFNRLASQAARKWKFVSTGDPGTREWLLQFEFGREGTTVQAVRARS